MGITHTKQSASSVGTEGVATAYEDGALVRVADGEPAAPLADRVHAAFRALVLDPEFPCVGARSALNQGGYRFALYPRMDDPATIAPLARDLHAFAAEGDSLGGEFTTFIACFDAPKVRDDLEFERLLWQVLAGLHEADGGHDWDPAVSRDPDAANFSFSLGGTAFFVVGLSPASSRWARSFPWPLLAFNPHAQFERLRESGGFERMQEVIRDRDREIEGDLNPNLANFGTHTEARQYSGREVEANWRCPVRFDD